VVPEHVLWWGGTLQRKSKPFNKDANLKPRHGHNSFYATVGRILLKDRGQHVKITLKYMFCEKDTENSS
jgi:hypothetical protein